ncbi:MAG: helix-turn-helix domain-containing protein [Planctomycetaceae bacterium]|nr:helix-turn-helix domain-containing protein [Planctomycetaceae bacterium]
MDDQTINTGEFYSVSDIARQLKISLAAVYELCQSGKLSHFRFGKGRGTIRISTEDLQAFLVDSRRESSREISARRRVLDELQLRPLKHIDLHDSSESTKSG